MNRPLADKHGYRGIEFRVDEVGQGEWEWAYYARAERALLTAGE